MASRVQRRLSDELNRLLAPSFKAFSDGPAGQLLLDTSGVMRQNLGAGELFNNLSLKLISAHKEGKMRRIGGLSLLFALFLFSTPDTVWADDGTLFGMERRRDQFAKDFSYFLYPISGKVPGIGTAYGAGATVTNIAGTDTDFTGFYVRGDFEATGAALLNYHLIDERLIFDIANYTAKVAAQSYKRGIDSSKDDYIHLEVDSGIAQGNRIKI